MDIEIIERPLGRAICPKCLSMSDSSFARLREDGWYLDRHCDEHGNISTLIDQNRSYFESVLHVLRPHLPSAECHSDCTTCLIHPVPLQTAILELLDECDTTCHTCVASSAPGLGNIRSWAKVKATIDTLNSLPDCRAIMISGGEPTIHPHFERIVDYVVNRCHFDSVIIISNGSRLATDAELLTRLSRYKDRIEIHLQYDSDRQSDLDVFRGNVSAAERAERLTLITDAGLKCTLICIVADGVNLNYAHHIIEIALANENVVGVTYQPLRKMGRLPDQLSSSEHNTTLGEVVAVLEPHLKAAGSEMKPHVRSPHSLAVAYLPRATMLDFETENAVVEETIYPSISKFGKHGIRILVNAYLDPDVYCEAFAQNCAVGFVSKQNNLIPVDTYYLFYHQS